MGIIYITGGAKSGKSKFAESIAMKKKKRIYLATSIPFDNEMKLRVKKHKKQRGDNWITLEAYRNLDEVLSKVTDQAEVILLDCLTNMITNLMIMDNEKDWDNLLEDEIAHMEKEIFLEINKIIDFSKKFSGDIIVVSNEVGMGLVPEYPLGRYFRDIAGSMNQLIAEKSKEAYLVVSGISMKIK